MTPAPPTTEERLDALEAAIRAAAETLVSGQRRVERVEADARALDKNFHDVVDVFLPHVAELIASLHALAGAIVDTLRAKGFTTEAEGLERADAALANLVQKLTKDWERARGGDVPPGDQAPR